MNIRSSRNKDLLRLYYMLLLMDQESDDVWIWFWEQTLLCRSWIIYWIKDIGVIFWGDILPSVKKNGAYTNQIIGIHHMKEYLTHIKPLRRVILTASNYILPIYRKEKTKLLSWMIHGDKNFSEECKILREYIYGYKGKIPCNKSKHTNQLYNQRKELDALSIFFKRF